MKKLWLILPFVLFTTLIFAFESDRWGRSAVTSANVTDSCKQVRSEITDSIVVFDDTMEANPVMVNDLQVIDSLQIPQWSVTPSTGVSGLFGADSTGDSLWYYFPGGKVAVYPQAGAGAMSQSDIVDTLNNSTVSMTQTWEWDGGNIIAADGQKVILTANDEGDSGSIYMGDSLHITADIPIRVGGTGITKIMDSLVIPTYAAFPNTGSEGLFGADSANDSLIAYWGGARRVIYPGAGGGADDWVIGANIGYWNGGTISLTTTTCFYYSATTADSLWSAPFSIPIEDDGDAIIIDSVLMTYYTQGVEDSIHVYLQYVNGDDAVMLDSAWFGGGSTGEETGNVVVNGDITLTKGTHDALRFTVGCVNNGNNDIRVPFYARIVCHK